MKHAKRLYWARRPRGGLLRLADVLNDLRAKCKLTKEQRREEAEIRRQVRWAFKNPKRQTLFVVEEF